MGAVDFVTTLAPGPARRAAHRQGEGGGRPHAGDGRPRLRRGRARRAADRADRPFLDVTTEVAGLAKVGPIHSAERRRDRAAARSPQTAVHLVTLLEEMPVQETIDAAAELRAARLPARRGHRQPGPPALLRRPALVARRRRPVDAAELRAGLARGRARRRRWPPALAARDWPTTPSAQRLAGRERAHGSTSLDLPTIELPELSPPVDLGELYELAELLRPDGARRDAAATARPTPLDLDALLATRRPGSSSSAAAAASARPRRPRRSALRAAEAGRRVVVLTIDPARRLAQSMGLTELDNTPREVKGIDPANGGSLFAMMLDMKRTFDDVVLAHSTPERAEQIFANPFYQSLSSSFAGTQEYMAMEKLGQLRGRRTSGT